MNWNTLKPIDTSTIKPVDFPEDRYYPIEYPKKQIVLHHTVSGKGITGDINTWLAMDGRIATCIVVDSVGIANQCLSSRFWAHHIGCKSTFLKEQGFSDWTTRNIDLNKSSIAIEIDSWGPLVLGDGTQKQFGDKIVTTISGKYYAAYGNQVDCEVVHYPNGFRGYYYYEKYNDLQIKTVGELLLLWNKKYNIPLDYNNSMWDISHDALSGKPGVWTHVSYRVDKSDCAPQEDLIEMLKTLKSLT